MVVDFLTAGEVANWLRVDSDYPQLDSLIQFAYDIAEGSITDFAAKLASEKFKRKLKLFILNIIVNVDDRRELTAERDDKLQYINATLLMQLEYGTYSEVDK